ncbi:MAG: hypothetical protein KJO56_00825 [Gammaproteobacteria bacterium]|nr:hypothetical protein [Gammaproteobacteria bacterium]
MNTRRLATCTMVASLLALTGCATSPEDEQRRKDMEADVDDILSFVHDPAEVGEIRNCLSESEFRSYRALGRRHLLFEGRQNRQWVNVLRGRCPGLDDDSVFIVEPNVAGRLCDMDRFSVVDRFDSIASARTAPMCVLGEFRPVVETQVRAIEDRLEMR